MAKTTKLPDAEAKSILQNWPLATEKWGTLNTDGKWIRAQPVSGVATGPRIRAPGTEYFATQPDGLFALFYEDGTYCDIIAIEVCGSVQNLNDKRSRYMPLTSSRVLDVQSSWLAETVTWRSGHEKPRWELSKSFKSAPADFYCPIRNLRVLYALPNEIYKKWCPTHSPSGYEYYIPHSSLASYQSPKMQEFLSRLSVQSQFYLNQRKKRSS